MRSKTGAAGTSLRFHAPGAGFAARLVLPQLLVLMLIAACASPTTTPTAPPLEPTRFPQPPPSTTFPVPPQPTANVELALPAPLPTPGGPVTAFPSLNGITDLAFAPDGAVWLATEWSVFRMNGQEFTRYEQQLPMAIAVDADGTVWVSHNPISGAGWLSTFDGASWHPVTDTLGVGVVTDLVATPDGGVWAGGAAGIARLAGPQGPRLYTTANGLPKAGVVDLAVGPDGELWAAGSSTVVRLDGDTWSTYELGVPDAQIKALAPGAGKIWLASNRGVFALAHPTARDR